MRIVVALMGATIAGSSAYAASGPTLRGYGPGIEPLPAYEGQERCAPKPKPGVVAFQQMVLERYPTTGTGGISRACEIGGQSEHKEGRAWDWGVHAEKPKQKAMADELLERLTKADRFGNPSALARRLGIMYIIWNREIWFPGSGWRVYCVQKDFGCHTPGDRKSLRHPHTDHVHFSFTWEGAKKKTTYWRKARTRVIAMASGGSGYWVATGNGAVAAFDTTGYGSLAARPLAKPVVAMAASPSGTGYLLLTKHARVAAFGGASAHGGAVGKTKRAAALASTPSGSGYWIAAAGGRLFARGDAKHHGGLGGRTETPIVGIAASAGSGYWMVSQDGVVTPFGDAPRRKGFRRNAQDVAGIVATPSGKGYWVFTSTGRVRARGDARHHGDARDRTLNHPIVGMARTTSGRGYWLVNAMGKVFRYGDAKRLGSVTTMARFAPVELEPDPSYPVGAEDFPDH